ncbi:Thymus-specific serine protease [Microtus ochrogaster]|uniref:Thymus-specific serine protease n=1 Tax=Microtus ochrogaster TaxID=79684 RepID=A0A8J6GGG2_MICOH|nr:Thymus-specific serine protease [Microtus ochrogaster]
MAVKAPWLALLILVSLWGPSAPALLLRRLREHIQRFQESSNLHLGFGLSQGLVTVPKQGWLEQPLDPFNASDRRTFLQRYWVNDRHRAGQDAPVFLQIGGEGSLGPGSVMAGHPAALAPAWGALVISLEHRFYGLSMPAGGLDMAQLRYLSSRHALADVASARQALTLLLNVSASSPWICFGGSYAGSLATWTRLKVPGIPRCLAAVSAAFAEVERLLRSGPAAQAVLKEELGACGSLDRTEDQGELLGALQALVGGTVQYDGQAGAPLSVRQLCGLLLGDSSNRSHSTPYLGLRRAVQIVLRNMGQRCLSFSRAETVAQLRTTEPQVSGVGDRQWLYQTCTEFGFSLPSQLNLCEQVFGLSAASVAQAVSQTNSYYGGQTPGATQVLYVNAYSTFSGSYKMEIPECLTVRKPEQEKVA